MRKLLLVLLLFSISSLDILAQNKRPNFSGTWIINWTKSYLDKSTKQAFEEHKINSIQMVIVHQKTKIEITNIIEYVDADLDKRIDKNSLYFSVNGKLNKFVSKDDEEDPIRQSDHQFYKSYWKNGKIIAEYYEKDEKTSKINLIDTIELSLSTNGEILSFTTKFSKFSKKEFGLLEISDSMLVFSLLKK